MIFKSFAASAASVARNVSSGPPMSLGRLLPRPMMIMTFASHQRAPWRGGLGRSTKGSEEGSKANPLHLPGWISFSGGDASLERTIELRNLFRRQLDLLGRGILLQIGAALGSGDRHDLFTLSQEPGESHLSRLAPFRPSDRLDRGQQGEVALQIGALEAGHLTPAILFHQAIEAVDRPAQKDPMEARWRLGGRVPAVTQIEH